MNCANRWQTKNHKYAKVKTNSDNKEKKTLHSRKSKSFVCGFFSLINCWYKLLLEMTLFDTKHLLTCGPTLLFICIFFLSNSLNVFLFAVYFYTDIRRQGAAERKHFHFSTVSLDSFFLYFLSVSLAPPAVGSLHLVSFHCFPLKKKKRTTKMQQCDTWATKSGQTGRNIVNIIITSFFCGQTFSRKLVKDERFQKQSLNCEFF